MSGSGIWAEKAKKTCTANFLSMFLISGLCVWDSGPFFCLESRMYSKRCLFLVQFMHHRTSTSHQH